MSIASATNGNKLETNAAAAPAAIPANRGEPARRKLPRSPIVAKSADQLDKDHTPPQPHARPSRTTSVQPKPERLDRRSNRSNAR